MTRSASSAGRITLWDASRLEKIAEIPHSNSSFSRDSTLLVTTSADGLTLWNITGAAPRLVGNITLDAPTTRPPVFSPDGQILAVAVEKPSPRIEIRHVAGGGRIAQLMETPSRGIVGAYAFSRDGTVFVTGYEDGRLRLWDVRTWTAGRLLEAHAQPVDAMAFSPDGRLLATAGADTTVQLWSTTFQTAPTALRGDAGASLSLAFTPDGETLAVGSADGVVKFWNLRARREVAAIKAHDSYVTSLAFSPDGQTLATISLDQTMRLWKAPSFAETDREFTAVGERRRIGASGDRRQHTPSDAESRSGSTRQPAAIHE
jgi:WD40 repeat protein